MLRYPEYCNEEYGTNRSAFVWKHRGCALNDGECCGTCDALW